MPHIAVSVSIDCKVLISNVDQWLDHLRSLLCKGDVEFHYGSFEGVPCIDYDFKAPFFLHNSVYVSAVLLYECKRELASIETHNVNQRLVIRITKNPF